MADVGNDSARSERQLVEEFISNYLSGIIEIDAYIQEKIPDTLGGGTTTYIPSSVEKKLEEFRSDMAAYVEEPDGQKKDALLKRLFRDVVYLGSVGAIRSKQASARK